MRPGLFGAKWQSMQTMLLAACASHGIVHVLFTDDLRRFGIADLRAVIDPAGLFGAAHDVGMLNGLDVGGVAGGEAVALAQFSSVGSERSSSSRFTVPSGRNASRL